MEYDSIQHKLNKYNNKLTHETNHYKKAIYAEKVGYYRQYAQSGGNLSEIIKQGTDKLTEEVNKTLKELPSNGIDKEILKSLDNDVDTIKKNFQNYINDTLKATVNFVTYNSSVRDQLRKIFRKTRESQDPNTITQVTKLTTELKNVDGADLSFNTSIIVKLGNIVVSNTEDVIRENIVGILDEINKNTNTNTNKIHPVTIEYAKNVKEQLEKSLKGTIKKSKDKLDSTLEEDNLDKDAINKLEKDFNEMINKIK